jgi:hypothetical protein
VDQVTSKKRAVNPSGLSALFDESDLMTPHTSSSVKRCSSYLRSNLYKPSSCRLMALERSAGVLKFPSK